MESIDNEFLCTLELIILSRNKNGATLMEIHDDFYELYDVKFETIWGYNYWEEYVTQLLTNNMLNIYTKVLHSGCIPYYMNLGTAIAKLSEDCSDNTCFIRDYLNIDLEKLQDEYNAMIKAQSQLTNRSNTSSDNKGSTGSYRSGYLKSVKIAEKGTSDCEFYGHSIIGDDFFLEIADIDLKFPKTIKNRILQIGQCISGQTIQSAVKNLPYNINKFRDRVIISLGSLDLMQGRELIDMLRDMSVLVEILLSNNIFPIVTTIPPLANHMHDKSLEKKRKSFNQFLVKDFAVVDIEDCFLSNFGRIIFDMYLGDAKQVTGSRLPFVLWNHIGRQRVVRMLKRKIPDIYDEIY